MERGLFSTMQNSEIQNRSRKSARGASVLAGALACGFAVLSAAPASAHFETNRARHTEVISAPKTETATPKASPGAKEKAAKKKADREAKKAEREAKKAAKKEHDAELAAAKRSKSGSSKSDESNLTGIGSDDPLEGL